jgi:hypothetical protein
MRVDLRIYIDSAENFNNPNDLDSSIKSILTAAIVKGLDVVGIVNTISPQVGWRAHQLCTEQNLDLYVVPGQEYTCVDKAKILVYKLKEALPPNLTLNDACRQAHQQNGFVMIANVGKRQAHEINKLAGSLEAPDAVEIYCAKMGGFQDVDVEYHRFITSGASSGAELESTNVFTMVDRKEIESMGLLPQGQGVEYTPNYLHRDDQLQQGADPSAVAQGTYAPTQEV